MEMVKWLSDKFQGCVVKSEVLEKAAEMGSMQILQLFLDNDSSSLLGRGGNRKAKVGHPVEWNGTLICHAVKMRHDHIAWWIGRHFPDVSHEMGSALMCTVKNGDIPLAEWLLSKGAEFSPGLIDNIARCVAAVGHLDVLQWLNSQHDVEGIVGLVLNAAEEGHFDIVRWLLNRDLTSGDSESDGDEDTHGPLTTFGGEAGLAVHIAAINGHLRVAKYLRAQMKIPANNVEREIQLKANGKRLQKLTRKLGPLNKSAVVSAKKMAGAVRNGHLDVVKWLCREFDDDPDVDLFAEIKNWRGGIAMDEAAGKGHLDVVQYLHELQVNANKRKRGQLNNRSSPKCTAAAMTKAASNGHLEVVKWLHANRSEGCTMYAMPSAVINRHLEVVQWLHQYQAQNCMAGAHLPTVNCAVHDGHLDVLKWMHFNTRASCTTGAMDDVAANGHLDVVQWLHENRREGCTTDAMDSAAGIGRLAIVKWLHRNRTEGCTKAAMDNAAKEGHLQVVEWLHTHRTEGCSAAAMNGAAEHGKFEVLLFLHNRGLGKCTAETQGAVRALRANVSPEIQAWIQKRWAHG